MYTIGLAAILTCFTISVIHNTSNHNNIIGAKRVQGLGQIQDKLTLAQKPDKMSMIIAGMPYVQRRSFYLRQQGGVTALIWPFSVLDGNNQRHHSSMSRKQEKCIKNMQGHRLSKKEKKCKQMGKYLILFSILSFLRLTELSLPRRYALYPIETPYGSCMTMIHKIHQLY